MKKVIRQIPLLILICILMSSAEAQVDTAWVRRYNGNANQDDQPYRETILAIDEIGNVYVTGITDKNPNPLPESTNYDYLTIKYNSIGEVKWIKSYNGPTDKNDIATAIAVDNIENVYVTGISRDSITGDDFLTIKYDSNGVEQWIVRYDLGHESDHPYCLAVDDSGNVYVGGSGTHLPGGWDYLVIKYNADGDTLWVRTYNGSADDEDYGTAMAIDSSGNVYITGRSHQSGTVACYDYVTIKYNSIGEEQWIARYNGPDGSTDEAWGIAVDGSGNVYITGASSTGYAWNCATVKYNTTGVQQWESIYDAPGFSWDNGYGIVLDGSGYVYVTGNADSDPLDDAIGYDYLTIKYNSDGDTIWVRWYNGTANNWDEAHAIAVDNSGNVYVTGYGIESGTGRDFVTIKYNSNGDEKWIARYNGPANNWDEAWALKIDDDNNVYVAGYSKGPGTWFDYATIKYNQLTGISEKVNGRNGGMDIIRVTPSIFSTETKISFAHVLKSNKDRITIYDINGRKVKQDLVANSPGSITWSGVDDGGNNVPPGVYFIVIDERGINIGNAVKVIKIR